MVAYLMGFALIATAGAAVGFSISTVLARDLRRLLESMESQTEQRLAELFLFIPLRKLALALLLPWCVAFAVLALWLPAAFWWPTMLASWVVPAWYLRRLRARRQRKFVQQLPDTLMLLSSGLKSGVPLIANLQLVVRESGKPMSDEIAVLLRQIRLGESFAKVVDDWLTRMPSQDLERVVIALKLAQQSGGQQALILTRLAQTMRAKQQLQLKVEALTAQGRMQGKVMSLLPLLMVAALYVLEQPTMLALAAHPLGWGSGAVLLMLLCTGYYLIRLQVRIEVPV